MLIKYTYPIAMLSLVLLSGCNSDSSSDTIATHDLGYTLAVLPDTQKYSRYSPERFWAQTQWIADNYQLQNIVFTAHLGDVVDLPREESEWDNARRAFASIESNPETPYSVLAGNHDILAYQTSGVNVETNYDNKRDLTQEPFLQHFHPERLSSFFPTVRGSDATGFNTYHVFEGGEREYLLLALDWRPSEETLVWAQQVLDDHPDTPVILTTHQLLNVDTNDSPYFMEQGVTFWDSLIAKNDQIFMTFNGHHHGEAFMEARNNQGRKVLMVLVDYQSGFWGGNGMMQLVNFVESENKIKFRSFSPWVEAIPEEDREPQDELERWIFEVDFDFEERFSNFNEGGAGSEPGAKVDGVIGYWIFDKDHKLTNPSDDNELVFSDLSGNGNAFVAKKNGFPSGEQDEHLVLIEGAPEFGYANGSLQLNNGHGVGGYYLSANTTMLPGNGVLEQYTVEVVVRLSDDWSEEQNAWGAIFAHIPSATSTINFHDIECSEGESCQSDDPTVALTSSSLKEFQWISTSLNGVGPSNWSWEVDKEYWYHVVITNDGQYTQMYVDGSLVMRTGETEQHGLIATPGGEWAIGISSWKGIPGSFFRGDVAEVRIADRVLDSSDWLINQ
ncbi:Serine/threonine protein phosphatase [Vibrio owensii]|uniref:Serine/threonine protein phosphatase n=1 Tax=Vibrio owensii TaxID=696485 RepID=A0AAU9Q4U1_9VIBR|nr:Serine/threonine protein phosphatase [Vibrio owensii]